MRSDLVTTRMIPLPALMISPARAWSSLAWGSVASTRRAQISASSMAARVRRAENFSIPTSRLPGFLRPAVSRISRLWPLNLISKRLMSLVVPCLLLTIACCFWPRLLKRLDLPTFGRPMRASFRAGFEGFSDTTEPTEFSSSLSKICFNSAIPCPVVAEVRKMYSSGMPRARNSLVSSASPRSYLFKIKKTDFLERRAERAIWRSRSSKYFVESTTMQIMVAESMASSICSLMEASKSSSGFFNPAVSTKRNRLSILA